jgi:hypothetical protein
MTTDPRIGTEPGWAPNRKITAAFFGAQVAGFIGAALGEFTTIQLSDSFLLSLGGVIAVVFGYFTREWE